MTRSLVRLSILFSVLGLLPGLARAVPAALEVVSSSGPLRASASVIEPGGRVHLGDRIVSDGGAVIRIPGKAAFRLKPGSVLTVTRWKKGFLLRLDRGGILSAVRKGTPYAVRTPTAVAAVRGTVFHVQVESPEKTYSCLCRGRYIVTTKAGDREVKADDHKAAVYTDKADQPAGLLYHSDEEIPPLEDLLK
jgi:hypothetical protein